MNYKTAYLGHKAVGWIISTVFESYEYSTFFSNVNLTEADVITCVNKAKELIEAGDYSFLENWETKHLIEDHSDKEKYLKQLVQESEEFPLEYRIAQKLINFGWTVESFHQVMKESFANPWTLKVYNAMRDIKNNTQSDKFKNRLNQLAEKL